MNTNKSTAEQIGKLILAYKESIVEAYKHQRALAESGYSQPWIDVEPYSGCSYKARLEVR